VTGVTEDLPSPGGVVAEAGLGQVTLSWKPVPGAVGYLVHRASAPDGPCAVLDHGGGDVLAVPHGPYADTTVVPGEEYWYAVAACSDMDRVGPLSTAVAAAPGADGSATVRAEVRADRVLGPVRRPWREMIGSEHLSHLECTGSSGGRPIGAELTAALRRVHDELGVRSVRAHGILGDDLGVYTEVDGVPVHDFTGVDRVYDRVVGLGLRPVVELSFMPRALASDPSRTIFSYRAGISPPRDWDRWADLVRALVAHLADRYGRAELREHWSFEVWNEANLDVFWSGTPDDYLRLYDVTAGAVRDVDPALRVGGPASAAAGDVDALLSHVDTSGAPLDFVSTHTYGSPPLDLRPLLAAHGRPDAPIWWTEWGTTPTHFNGVGDTAFAAAFLTRGMRSAAGRIDALAHWVASDHFEELGRPPRLLHGGFGLLTIGNLRKPRYHALAMLERLASDELATTLTGDGAGSLVELWPSLDPTTGRLAIALWNGTLDQSKTEGADGLLDRTVELAITGLRHDHYQLTHWRIDDDHSNIATTWQAMSQGRDWPTDQEWEALRAADRLDRLTPDRELVAEGGTVEIRFGLPMPAVSLLELIPVDD
jgi:xylan 1,4-beta-xylosidase